MSDNEKGYYNSERKGFETKDGGLIRINHYLHSSAT